MNFQSKKCVVCDSDFIPKSGINKFCSPQCKGKWPYITGKKSTENQYKEISGNWTRYFSRLLYTNGRRKDKLTRDVLLLLLKEQNHLCALTKLPLTCELSNGVISLTNASIDRINPGSEYTKENIRLVCRIVNIMKWNMSDEELFIWCQRILDGKKTT